MDKFIIDGYRFLNLKPAEVLGMTHKEFNLLMKGNKEKTFDQLEMYSIHALMIRRAYHERKRLKATDLFKRPKESAKQVDKKDMVEEMQQAKSYLSQFENFNLEENPDKGGH